MTREEDTLLDYALGYVEWMEQQFEDAEADWLPIAFLEVSPKPMADLARGDDRLVLVNGDEQDLEDERKRGLLMLPLPGDPSEPEIYNPFMDLMARVEAKRVVVIFTAYMSYDSDVRVKYGRVARAPSAIEAVLALDLTKERLEIWHAEINRSDLPPMLSPWQHQAEGARTEFTDHLKEALT